MATIIKCPNCGTEISTPDAAVAELKTEQEAEVQALVKEEQAIEQTNKNELYKLQTEYEAKIAALQQELDVKTKQLTDIKTELQTALGRAQQ